MFRKITLFLCIALILTGGVLFAQNSAEKNVETTKSETIVAQGKTITEVTVESKGGWFRWGAVALVIFGAALAVGLAGTGSAIGISRPASMGLGAMQEDSQLFLPTMILAALPGTQGIYGFVVAFMALSNSGIMSGGASALTIDMGWQFFFACLPIAITGLVSAIYQGNVCAAGVGLASKDRSQWSRGMILGVFVEFYAILGFLISLLVMFQIKG